MKGNLLLFIFLILSCESQDLREKSSEQLDTIVLKNGDSIYVPSSFRLDEKKVEKKEDNFFEAGSKLNESSIYTYKIDSNGVKHKKSVWKYDYHKEDYYIDLQNDSIAKGDPIVIMFSLRFICESSTIEIIDSKNSLQKFSKSDFSECNLVFKSTDYIKGVNSIKGTIITDQERIPFEYKYFVR